MDRDQSIKLMQDLLRRVIEKKASDLFITAGFSAANQSRRRDPPRRASARHRRAVLNPGARDHERSPDARVDAHQRM